MARNAVLFIVVAALSVAAIFAGAGMMQATGFATSDSGGEAGAVAQNSLVAGAVAAAALAVVARFGHMDRI